MSRSVVDDTDRGCWGRGGSLGRPGQEAVLEGVPDVLVDAVADAVELGHVRRHCWMPTHLHSAGVSPSPQ